MKRTMLIALGFAASGIVFANDMTQAGSTLDMLAPADVEGKNVMSTSGEKLGDVDSVVYGSENGEKLVIIGLEGLVGDGAKEVAVPMESLTLADGGDHLILSTNKATLENQPDVDPGSYQKVESD